MRSTTEHVECGGCGQVLLGEALKVSPNLHYHIQCFLCCTCNCELVNTGFFTKLAKYYCAEDYHSEFGTQCALCSRFIEGEGLSVQGRSYHMSCLSCHKCNAQFDGGSRITFEREQPTCDDCKQIEKQSTDTPVMCFGCGKVIVGTSIFAIDNDWHMDCFKCRKCDKSLSGEYMCKDGVPYCEEDYQTLFGQSCNICSEYIIGKVLQAGGNSYHTSCLKCYICTKQFEEGQEIFMQDELFWHTECDDGTPDEDPLASAALPVAKPSDPAPPALILPPPPSASPPPDTPPATYTAPDTPPTTTIAPPSPLSPNNDYVMVDPNEANVSSADEKASVKDEIKSKSSSKSVKSKSSLTPDTKLLEQSKSSSSIVSDYEELVIPIPAETPPADITAPVETPKEVEIKTNGDIIISEPVVEISKPLSNGLNDKHSLSDSSSCHSDKENQKDEAVVAENCKSVSEMLKMAKEKEEVAPPKIGFSLSKKFQSLSSEEGSDLIQGRHPRNLSESSDGAPNKPPSPHRKQSPERNTAVESAPSPALVGLKSVNSPVLKLLEDIDNKNSTEEINYFPLAETYSLNQLQNEKIRLPKEIDRSRLQDYLNAEDFQSTFKMDKAAFVKLPAWKKNNVKKAAKLF